MSVPQSGSPAGTLRYPTGPCPPSGLILAIALVAYAALAFGYVTLTPIWQNPDEPAHFNYVAFVANTGGLPELRPGDWDSALLQRLKNGQLGPGDSVSAIRYEAWQPPLAYLAAAPVFRLGPNPDLAAEVQMLRSFDALLGGLTLVVAFYAAREVLPAHLAMAVPLTMAGVPMFTSVSASISADPLANLVAAGLVLLLLWRVRHDTSGQKWVIGTGALIGLGLLTKLALAIFVPLAILVIMLRASRRVLESVLLLGATGVVVLPWLAHQITSYGWTDPLATTRHAQVVLDQQRFAGVSPDYAGAFLTTTFHSFWAQFGWMAVVAPDRLYWIWGLLTLVAAAGLVVQRARLAEPAWRIAVLTVVAAVVGYVGYNLAYVQFQGRYLFTALVPLVILLVSGWAAWLPRRVQSWGVLVVGLMLVALNAYALWRVLVPGFAPIA